MNAQVNMELDFDSNDVNSEVLSLIGVTLAEEHEVSVEHEELLGAGSSECYISVFTSRSRH